MTCCIKGCNSRRDKNALPKRSFFTAYTNDMFIAWSNVLSNKNINLTKKSAICELHFNAEDIVREDAFLQDNGAVIYVNRTKPKLKEGAVPSIFPPEKVPFFQHFEHKNIDGMSSEVSSETSHSVEEQQMSKFSAENMSSGKSTELPTSYWITNINESYMMWTCWANDLSQILRRVILTPNMKLQVFIENKEISFNSKPINNIQEMKPILLELQNFFPCEYINDEDRVTNCKGYVINRQYKKIQRLRCLPCQKNWKKLLRKQHKYLKDKCCKCNEEIIEEGISNLPQSQQLAVRACFAAAKLKDKKGIRYSNEWVYECILLRIKSTKTYNHLRSRNILTLPSITTLNRYTKNVKGCYGFQTSTFEILRKKTANMKPNDVRGVLLLDEMKLSKTLYFNRTNLKVEGFVDLGSYTSTEQKQKKGDHAFVLMFQPFKGTWVQSLACFLSVGNTSASTLHKIIMECIILTEQSGLKIDAVVSDGASWNRSMWNIYGVTEECVSVEHVVDIQRRLWVYFRFSALNKMSSELFFSI